MPLPWRCPLPGWRCLPGGRGGFWQQPAERVRAGAAAAPGPGRCGRERGRARPALPSAASPAQNRAEPRRQHTHWAGVNQHSFMFPSVN